MRKSRLSRLYVIAAVFGWGLIFAGLSLIHAPAIILNPVGAGFLLIVPGMLTYITLGVPKKLPMWSKLSMVLGFSILELIVTGLIINTLLVRIGIQRPLDTPYIAGAVATLVLLLLGLMYWRGRGWTLRFSLKKGRLSRTEKWAIGLPCLAILCSVLGSISINNHGSYVLTAVMLGGVTTYSFWLMRSGQKIRDGIICLALLQIGLSLLLATSLRGWFTTGHDVQREFYVFSLAKNAGKWNISSYRDSYNACMSITILPTMFANLLKFNDPYIYKILYQIIFAVTPGIVYTVSRRYLQASLAIATAVWYMAFPTFFSDMPMLNRQEIAFLFLGIMLLIVFESRITLRLRNILFLLFGVGLVLSHYSTTYSVIAILLGAVGLQYFMILRERYHAKVFQAQKVSLAKAAHPIKGTSHAAASAHKKPNSTGSTTSMYGPEPKLARQLITKNPNFTNRRPFLRLSLVLFLVAVSFAWTTLITNTSGNTNKLIQETFKTALHGGKEDSRSGDVSYGLLSRKKPDIGQDRLKNYNRDIVAPFRAAEPGVYYPSPVVDTYPVAISNEKALPYTAAGLWLERYGINSSKIIRISRQGSAKILQLLIVVGFLYVLIKKTMNYGRPDKEYFAIALGSMFFVLAQIALPLLSAEYGLLRAFQQSLMVLGLFVIIGTAALIPKFFKEYTIVICELLAVIFLLTSTGILTQTLGGYLPQLYLNNSGSYYNAYYLHENEVVAANWLDHELTTSGARSKKAATVQADRYTAFKINNIHRFDLIDDIMPGHIRTDSYVFLGESTTVQHTAMLEYNGDLLLYKYPNNFLDTTKDTIYSNGTSTIYR